MRVALLRHASCAGNLRHAYVGGKTDEPLCPTGLEDAGMRRGEISRTLLERGFQSVVCVYVSPMMRCRQTARALFDGIDLVGVEGLREMDFGIFEGKSAHDMETDRDYRAWVDGMCEGCCPQGESRAEFAARTCGAFEDLLATATGGGVEQLVIVAHGGTLMALMDAYAEPSRDYFSWHVDPCHGYSCEARLLDGRPVLVNVLPL